MNTNAVNLLNNSGYAVFVVSLLMTSRTNYGQKRNTNIQ